MASQNEKCKHKHLTLRVPIEIWIKAKIKLLEQRSNFQRYLLNSLTDLAEDKNRVGFGSETRE